MRASSGHIVGQVVKTKESGDMSADEDRTLRFLGAERLLPFGIRTRTERLCTRDRETAEEIRLRVGRPPSVLLPDGELQMQGDAVSIRDIESVMEVATQASVHSASGSMRNGYITTSGGYRVGICGTGVIKNTDVVGIRNISSLSIRIPREVRTAGEGVLKPLCPNGVFESAVIISPPGMGKTTLLRDVVRRISDGDAENGIAAHRVALADERGEVAAMFEGRAQMDVGCRTDVMDGCPKAQAIIMLLRAMNPQVIAVDEITAAEDIRAMSSAANCGVALLATAHASSAEDLLSRPLYRQLMQESIFKRAVIIQRIAGERVYTVTNPGEIL